MGNLSFQHVIMSTKHINLRGKLFNILILLLLREKHTLHYCRQIKHLRCLLGIGWALKARGWSSIRLSHKRDVRPIGEIGVIPPTQIICIKKWIIGWSRIEIVDIVNLVTRFLGKWNPNLAIHSQMVNGTTYFT